MGFYLPGALKNGVGLSGWCSEGASLRLGFRCANEIDLVADLDRDLLVTLFNDPNRQNR